jgi:hypothetical protein
MNFEVDDRSVNIYITKDMARRQYVELGVLEDGWVLDGRR